MSRASISTKLAYFEACCKHSMRKYARRLYEVLLKTDTAPTRFWFAIASLGFAIDTIYSTNEISDKLMFAIAPEWAWVMLFTLNAIALLYGVFTKRYDTILLFFEGILGTALWMAAAFAHIYAHGSLDAVFAGGLIALWLLIRYPTHWEYSDGSE